MPSSDAQQNALGRAAQYAWNGLTPRIAYRTAVAAVDVAADLADDDQVPPINMKSSKQAQNGAIFAFLRLFTAATSVTIQLWVNVLDVVSGSTPAEDETDWCLVESATSVGNGLVRLDGANHMGLPAGTYKILVTEILDGQAGTGTVDIHKQDTNV